MGEKSLSVQTMDDKGYAGKKAQLGLCCFLYSANLRTNKEQNDVPPQVFLLLLIFHGDAVQKFHKTQSFGFALWIIRRYT